MDVLFEKLRKKVTSCVQTYHLIEPGDRVMVCVSGGKDSALMYAVLDDMARRSPFKFELFPVMLDQKQPNFQADEYRQWIERYGRPLTLIEEDTYSIVKEKVQPGKTYCSLCSKLRRAILYRHAQENNYTKIALGHHRDDANTTFLMNAFFGGSLSGMPAKLISDDGLNTVIRPLLTLPEDDIIKAVSSLNVPIIPCNLCGSQENLQRKKISRMIKELEKDHPKISYSLFSAQTNIKQRFLPGGENGMLEGDLF